MKGQRKVQMADAGGGPAEQEGAGALPTLPTVAASFIAHLVMSLAPLQSGGNLESCTTLNATTNMLPADSDCVGGVASIAAALRALPDDEPSLFLPWLDRESVFVQMHPLRLGTNRLVLHDYFDFPAFLSTHAVMTLDDNGRNDREDLSSLRTHDFPLLITNTLIPPANPWREYAEIVHFDDSTGLAVLYVEFESKTLGAPDLPSTIGALNYVSDSQQVRTEEGKMPWIPVVVYSIKDMDMWQPFVEGLLSSDNPPQAIIGTFYSGFDEEWNEPRRMGKDGTWVMIFGPDDDLAHRFELKIDDSAAIANVAIIEEDLEVLPLALRGSQLDQYLIDQTYLKELDEVAIANDPTVGRSDFMHWTRLDDYRFCMAGECALGNLWADAVRWGAGVDVAFVPSGGLRGPGWEAGEVHVSDIYRAMPFSNILCAGVMSGVSLFKLLNYSTSVATFQGMYTPNGDRLLQISGARYTYNTLLNSSRLISIDIWNETSLAYESIDRLRMYSFAAESFLCDVFDPFPELLGLGFDIEGEVPAEPDDSRYVQEVVASFLNSQHSMSPYNTKIQGRLVNDTARVEAMNLVQTEEGCEEGTYWIESIKTCQTCPEERRVAFSENLVELEAVQGTRSDPATISIVNTDVYPVDVVVIDVPIWAELSYVDPPEILFEGDSKLLGPGGRFVLNVIATASLNVGTAVGAVQFGVRDSAYPGCFGSSSFSFDIDVTVLPADNLNHLGTGIRAAGYSLMSIVIGASIGFAIFTAVKRRHKVIRASQPFFLITCCLGCFIFISTIGPLSVDDSIASQRGCDIACAATPWLASVGFTTIFSALFAKIWRINKIWKNSDQFRRVKISEQDVLRPFLVLLFLNCLFLSLWTGLDPLRWVRLPVEQGNPFETIGSCTSNGTASKVFGSLTICVDAAALIFAVVQAWQARNISTEYSESKFIGIAIFGWLQITVVGLPLMFLLQSDPTARFFLISALLFSICISVLGLLFVPKVMHMRKHGKRESKYKRTSGLRKQLQIQSQSKEGGKDNMLPPESSIGDVSPTDRVNSSIYKSIGGGEGLKFVLPQTNSERNMVENELEEYRKRCSELEKLLEGVNEERRASGQHAIMPDDNLEYTEEERARNGNENSERNENNV